MKNLRIEPTSVNWEFEERTISVDVGCRIKGVHFVTSENTLLVLSAERGEAEDLLAFNQDGTLRFSLRSPNGFFFKFSGVNGDVGVTCGYELMKAKNYLINFSKMSLEQNGI